MQSHFQREKCEKRSIKSQNLWILASNFIPLKWQFIGKIIYFCYNTQNCTYVWARKSTEFRMSFNVCLSNSKKDFDSLCCYTRYIPPSVKWLRLKMTLGNLSLILSFKTPSIQPWRFSKSEDFKYYITIAFFSWGCPEARRP